MILGLVAEIGHRSSDFSGLATALFFGALFLITPATTPSGTPVPILNGPAWSLMYELAANAAMAAFWSLLRNRVLVVVCAVAGVGFAVGLLYLGTADMGGTWPTSWLLLTLHL